MLDDAPFCLHRTFPGQDFDDVVSRVRAGLAANGFGVLTEIDLAGTIRKKLGHEMGRYLILGACHPPSAWAAYQAEPAIGLLLPCNVVVAEQDADIAVGAIDPAAMFQVVEAEGLDAVVTDVRQRLEASLAAV